MCHLAAVTGGDVSIIMGGAKVEFCERVLCEFLLDGWRLLIFRRVDFDFFFEGGGLEVLKLGRVRSFGE